MKRRSLLKQGMVGGATSAVAIACRPKKLSDSALKEQPVLNWRMTTSWPRYLIYFVGVEILCQRVSDMTSGRFTITPYEGEDLVPPLELFDAVADGRVECGHTALIYFFKKSPALAFATALPFGLTAQQQNAWFYSGGGIEAIQKVLEPFGLVWFPAGNSTAQMGGWFRKPINTVGDLRGLKLRVTGLGGEILNRLGAETVTLAAQDIVPALLEGSIDAVEWVGPGVMTL